MTYLYDYHNHPYAIELLAKAHVEVVKRELGATFFDQLTEQNQENLEKQKISADFSKESDLFI